MCTVSTASTEAPRSRSSLATSTWPFTAAKCSAVLLFWGHAAGERRQHAAGVGREPQDRRVAGVPGEDAHRVGQQQAIGSKIAADVGYLAIPLDQTVIIGARIEL